MLNIHRLLLAISLVVTGAWPSWAQSRYPEKTIQLIAPYAPGGAADIFSRLLASELEKRVGQSVIVINRPVPERSSAHRLCWQRRRMAIR